MTIRELKQLVNGYDEDYEISCRTPNGEEWDIKEFWKIGDNCSLILRRAYD
jgi:hypothetical protein